MLKNPPVFLKKIYKNQFLVSWCLRGPNLDLKKNTLNVNIILQAKGVFFELGCLRRHILSQV